MRCRCWWGLSIVASIHLTQLARPGLSFEPSPVPPSVLFASIFFFFHVAFSALASFAKGRMLSVLLPLVGGARGPRGRQTRVDRSVATSLLIASHLTKKSPSPTAQEAGFRALADSWHENTLRDGTPPNVHRLCA